jgi:hypothetical protein
MKKTQFFRTVTSVAATTILLTGLAGLSASLAQQPVPSITGDSAPAAVEQPPRMLVVLNGLDKITARISTIEIPVGEYARFGTLNIIARTCYKQPPEEPPETAAFLEIEEVRPGFEKVRLFSGWMFASSPALSALEHPVYDVWVTDCKALAPVRDSGTE